MSLRTVRRVLAKELRETLRDRRTLVMMLVIPVFLYPVLFVVMEQAMIFGQRSLAREPAPVAVTGGPDAELAAFLAADSGLRVVAPQADPREALRTGEVQALVALPDSAADSAGTASVGLLYDGSRDRSLHARNVVEARLDAWGDTLLSRRLAARGLPATFAAPLEVAGESVATAEELGGYALGRILPVILVLMTILGAFYPAIDLAAGEKERGTLETLLTAPVPARDVVAGKFAAVALIGLAAAALNLGSMLLTFQSGVFKLSQVAGVSFTLPAGSVLLVMAGLVPLAVLFAAVFLGISVRAQSFKEAQNALTPVYVASLLPVILASMPGIELTPAVALIPVGGVTFLFRALISGTAEPLPALLAVGSTVVYAAAALRFAAASFGREEVLFGSGSGEVARGDARSLGERLRGALRGERALPLPAEGFAFIAAVALLFFYVAPRLHAALGERGILAASLLLIGLPAVAFAVLGPWDARRTLGLRPASPRAFAAAVLIAVGGMPVGWALGWLQLQWMEVPEELFGMLEQLVTATSVPRFFWLLLVVALVPAVTEELAFRGVLFRSLETRMPGWRAALAAAVVFGAFHLSYETAIRFLPTAWIGVLAGLVAWRTGSLYPAVLMHFVNNGLAVVVVSVPALQGVLLPGGEPRWALLALGPVLIAAGAWLLAGDPRSAPASAPQPAAGAPGRVPPAVVPSSSRES